MLLVLSARLVSSLTYVAHLTTFTFSLAHARLSAPITHFRTTLPLSSHTSTASCLCLSRLSSFSSCSTFVLYTILQFSKSSKSSSTSPINVSDEFNLWFTQKFIHLKNHSSRIGLSFYLLFTYDYIFENYINSNLYKAYMLRFIYTRFVIYFIEWIKFITLNFMILLL